MTWVSSDPDVATVSPDGVVTAVGSGEAEITAQYKDKVSEPVKVVVSGIAVESGFGTALSEYTTNNTITLKAYGDAKISEPAPTPTIEPSGAVTLTPTKNSDDSITYKIAKGSIAANTSCTIDFGDGTKPFEFTYVAEEVTVDVDGKDVVTYPKPETGKRNRMLSPATSDEFNGRKLGLQWQWNHNPDNSLWSVSEREGYLRLTTGSITNTILQAKNILSQRTFGPVSSASTSVDVSGMKDGDYAGLTLFQEKYGFVAVKKVGDKKYIVMTDASGKEPVEVVSIPCKADKVYFKAECDFRDRTDKGYFYYSLDGKKWMEIGSVIKMQYTLSHFMGYRFGLFNYATKEVGGHVDFDYFNIDDDISK